MTDDPRPCQCGHPYLSHALGGGWCCHGMATAGSKRPCSCEAWTGQPTAPTIEPILTVTQQPHPGRTLPTVPVVAVIWVKATAEEIGLDLDAVDDAMPVERRQLAGALRDLANALDAEATAMGER